MFSRLIGERAPCSIADLAEILRCAQNDKENVVYLKRKKNRNAAVKSSLAYLDKAGGKVFRQLNIPPLFLEGDVR